MTARRVDHVVVAVHDIDDAVETWETILGVPVTHRADIDQVGIRQAFFSLDSGFIELVAPMSDDSPLASTPEGVHTIALEIEDMDATVDALVARGVRVVGQGTGPVVVHPKSATGVRVQLWPAERPHRWQADPRPRG